jgi:hypothetical protein
MNFPLFHVSFHLLSRPIFFVSKALACILFSSEVPHTTISFFLLYRSLLKINKFDMKQHPDMKCFFLWKSLYRSKIV